MSVCVCVCLWGPFRCTWENGHVNYRTTFPVLRADRRLYFLRPFILHWYYLRAHTICTSCIRTTHGHKYTNTHVCVCNAYIDTNVLYMSVAIFPSINIDQSHRQTRTFITVQCTYNMYDHPHYTLFPRRHSFEGRRGA